MSADKTGPIGPSAERYRMVRVGDVMMTDAERALLDFLREPETREAIDGGRKLYATAPPSFVWGDPDTMGERLREILSRIAALDG